jgi:hypothetical protein
MESIGNIEHFLASLSRWRDSCIFYFKFDLALIAAAAALVSFFRLEGTALLTAAFQYKFAIHYLVVLLVYAIFFEINITSTSNRIDLETILGNPVWRARMYGAFKWAYGIQVFAHVVLLSLVLGFVSGYVDGFMSCRAGSHACGS